MALRRLSEMAPVVTVGVAGAVAVDVGVDALASSRVVPSDLKAVPQPVVAGSQAAGQGAGAPRSAIGPAVSGGKAVMLLRATAR